MFTAKQIAALKFLLYNANVRNQTTKQILALLINRSRKLAKEVCLTLVQDRDGYTAEEIDAAAKTVSILLSSNSTTHLNEVLKAMGSDFVFSVHYGDFNPSRSKDQFSAEGMFAGFDKSQVSDGKLLTEGMPLRYTFWLAKDYYSRQAVLVKATRDSFEKINLGRPGLYPNIEVSR